MLYGGGGEDFLIGGRGADRFLYLTANEGGDRIEGFQSGTDKFLIQGPVSWFEKQPEGIGVIYGIGELHESQFFIGSAASNNNQYFGYNPASNTVLYDANGSAEGGVTVIAQLTGNRSGIVASDIKIF